MEDWFCCQVFSRSEVQEVDEVVGLMMKVIGDFEALVWIYVVDGEFSKSIFCFLIESGVSSSVDGTMMVSS